MAVEIVMPKLSDTMTEGVFGSWKKSIGDPVQRGDVIAEVETDKAVMDLEAFASGILLEQRVHSGELVPVGTVIGLIGLAGEAVAKAEPEPPVSRIGIGPEKIMSPEELPVAPPITESMPDKAGHHDELAGPVVRRKAREMGIDLSQLQGSGPGGRILLEDLERYSGVTLAHSEAAIVEPLPPEQAEPPTTSSFHKGEPPAAIEQPLSRMRAAIARSVDKAWREIPHFSVTMEVDMEAAREVRRELKASGTPVSINDMVIKGAALALKAFPMVNAAFGGDRVIMHSEINIGIAVSLEEGLLVPVLKGCDHMTLAEVALTSERLIKRARSGQLSESELSGGTFSISNLGMYGVNTFSAVIHPSQGAILAVGALRETVIVKNGQPASSRIMNLNLSADHRLLDGAYAARFLKELKHILENPVRLLL
jgi:pyruvate dehydrogenase E2 component (dihydrolipoamide acetyltransferase)